MKKNQNLITVKEIFKTVNQLLKEKKITKIDFAKKLGTTRQNVDRMEKESEIKLSYLLKMADILEVNVNVFFDNLDFTINKGVNYSKCNMRNSENVIDVEPDSKEIEIDLLKQTIKDKEKIISLLENQIKVINNS
jgi:DNA-binding Xre family transcriptional regulator